MSHETLRTPPRVRPPAVAGSFYPASPTALERSVRRYLAEDGVQCTPTPVAAIVPHAGYAYSGPVAGRAYATLARSLREVKRVALFGPAHFVPFRGMALPSVDAFATPLGLVAIDHEAAARLRDNGNVIVDDAPHAPEHSLEVQLPFLQVAFGSIRIVPVVCGDAPPEAVASALEVVAGLEGTLVLISTDLSHYHDWATARRLDEATATAVEALTPEALAPGSACGRVPLSGLLHWARQRRLRPIRIDLRNSGDTAGDRARVVGYGAWVFLPPGPDE